MSFIISKKQGLQLKEFDRWKAAFGYQKLHHRRGTSWRMLGDAARATSMHCASAKEIMLTRVSVIKRPVLVWPGGKINIGFNETAQRKLIGLV